MTWEETSSGTTNPRIDSYQSQEEKLVCGNDSHWKRDCPERKNTPHSPKPSNLANVASNLPLPIALTAALVVSNEEWVLDSCCTFHIIPRKDLLSELVEFEGKKVMMGNNTHCVVEA